MNKERDCNNCANKNREEGVACAACHFQNNYKPKKK